VTNAYRTGQPAWRWTLAISLLTSLALAQASPASKAAADSLFDEGKRLSNEGKYAEACPKFEESQRLDPTAGTLLYLAECYERAGRTASAWTTFREAAALARETRRADREKTARDRAAALEKRLVRLRLEVRDEAPGLEIRRNGEVISRGLWGATFAVDPGPQKIEASAPNRTPWSKQIEASAGVVTVEIPALAPVAPTALSASPSASAVVAPPPPSPPPPVAPPPAPAGASPTTALVAGGVGVVGLAAGSFFGLRSFSRWNDSRAEALCNAKNECTPEGKSLIQEARSAATLSTIFFAVGVAGVATGAVLWFTAPAEKHQLGLALSPGGATLRGTW
jgi:serine/threonine-protein kinase